jgi:hypothetical protein
MVLRFQSLLEPGIPALKMRSRTPLLPGTPGVAIHRAGVKKSLWLVIEKIAEELKATGVILDEGSM